MLRGLMVKLSVLALGCAGMASAATVGVYFNEADWQAAMTLNGANPLTNISFADDQWTSTVEQFPLSTSVVSQSATAAGDGMPVLIASTCGAPGPCSSFGAISNGNWNDNLTQYSSTTFNFGAPIYGFGGYFDISGGNGLFISPAGEVVSSGYDGFIGIVSEQPLNGFFISWVATGSGICSNCFGNSYTLENLAVATIPTPEPSSREALTAVLLGSALYGSWCRFLKRCKSV